jgi:hypothetical protein
MNGAQRAAAGATTSGWTSFRCARASSRGAHAHPAAVGHSGRGAGHSEQQAQLPSIVACSPVPYCTASPRLCAAPCRRSASRRRTIGTSAGWWRTTTSSASTTKRRWATGAARRRLAPQRTCAPCSQRALAVPLHRAVAATSRNAHSCWRLSIAAHALCRAPAPWPSAPRPGARSRRQQQSSTATGITNRGGEAGPGLPVPGEAAALGAAVMERQAQRWHNSWEAASGPRARRARCRCPQQQQQQRADCCDRQARRW